MSFSEIGLTSELAETVAKLGYDCPTPIQNTAIPLALQGKDILACAQTGTGKTAAFLLPTIEIIKHSRSRHRLPSAVILAPTRELATQVYDNFLSYTAGTNLKAISVVGGEIISIQERILKKGVDILIATPGRLIDLFERGKLILTNVKVVVIDEADRMLDMGFMPEVDKIFSFLPRLRQTLMFSATISPEIKRISQSYQILPCEIKISRSAKTAETIEQSVFYVEEMQKRVALRKVLRSHPSVEPTVIFCNKKKDVDILAKSLQRHGFSAQALHGDMDQRSRNETLENFRKGNYRILVTTDVAARGIDVSGITLVINFDVPVHEEDYVHRIGRTGRAGKNGVAIMFVTKGETKKLKRIESLIKQDIKEIQIDLNEIMEEEEPTEKVVGFGKIIPPFMLIDPLKFLAQRSLIKA
ncbi:DEAD/DEAH box helicase [Candidatus Odyssella thessalonicensis]|uniref:DEAD/DEAH box helicase n=1 Tax=Candidatus Odyssella thessalonicensis TaxID=84647 RepID=UPI000225B453|nr:DEAD/DEAH box helicase [Candidatus Odyssella thessalonicensis]